MTSVRVTANFMKEENNREEARANKAVDRTKARLKQLETGDAEGGVELTQKEYIDRITKLHSDMQRAWKNGERVLTIKIVVKVAKLLGDVSSPKFYPSVFICVTEIMDTFGDLVYQRIISKAKVGENGKKVKVREQQTEAGSSSLPSPPLPLISYRSNEKIHTRVRTYVLYLAAS